MRKKIRQGIAILGGGGGGSISVTEKYRDVWDYFFLTPRGLYRSKLVLGIDTAMVQGIQRAHAS